MTPHDKQVMMFSATLSKEIRPVCKKFMQDVMFCSLPQLSLPQLIVFNSIAPVVVLQLLLIYWHQSCHCVICCLQVKAFRFLVSQCVVCSQFVLISFLIKNHRCCRRWRGRVQTVNFWQCVGNWGQIKEVASCSEDAITCSWSTSLQFAAHSMFTWFYSIGLDCWFWFSISLGLVDKEAFFCWD